MKINLKENKGFAGIDISISMIMAPSGIRDGSLARPRSTPMSAATA